jgi:hypothetical protein
MSWQVSEAMRDHSEACGATLNCGFVWATYASADGSGVYPGLTTVMRQAKVSKKTAIKARRWFIDNGEAVITGSKPSHTGTPIPVLDFGPLLLRAKGGASPPSDGAKGGPSTPFASEGGMDDPLRVEPVHPRRGEPGAPKGVASTPEPERNANTESENEAEDARAEARGSSSGLSPFSSGPSEPPAAHLAAERRDDEAELAKLEAQLPITQNRDGTMRAIASLQERLGLTDAKVVAA